MDEALRKGDLKFTLHGKKLQGSWVLVRTRGFGKSPRPSWLLIKHRDAYAGDVDIAMEEPRSAAVEADPGGNRARRRRRRRAGGDRGSLPITTECRSHRARWGG